MSLRGKRTGATDQVKALLIQCPNMRTVDVAEEVGCSHALVSRIKSDIYQGQLNIYLSVGPDLRKYLIGESRKAGRDVRVEDIAIGILTDAMLDAQEDAGK